MKVEESRKKVELKSTFSRVEKMKVEVDKSTRTFECSTFFRSVHAYGAPLVAAKSSTFFLLPRPFVCYSRLLTVAR